MARQPSEAAQMIWMENEGALLANIVPVRKQVKGGRRYELYAGETYLRWDRSGPLPVLREHHRISCKVTQKSTRTLRALRLTRHQRDLWDIYRHQIERVADMHEAEQALLNATTEQEHHDAMDRLSELDPNADAWMEDIEDEYEKARKGSVSVTVPG